MDNQVLNGIMGLAVGDALGVPFELKSRNQLERNPFTSMQGYGTFNKPAGTWSDDTSMTLGLVDSLIGGLDYDDIMKRFYKWLYTGEYTPPGEVFGVGNATSHSIGRFAEGTPALGSGGTSEKDNGNGSLMRILPIIYYLQSTYGNEMLREDKSFEIIHNVSGLTHAHKRSQIACGIYISIASELTQEKDLNQAIKTGIYMAMKYYKNQDQFLEELSHFNRIEEIAQLPKEKIKSSGYVVDTLEAAIWCLLTTESYKECVLKAFNLGGDTDTVAAVAGGLAGIYYGYDSIPKEWINTLVKKEYIEKLSHKLNRSLTRTEVERLVAFIPYFETITSETVASWEGGEKTGEKSFTMPYPNYDDKLINFINEFYKTNLTFYNYLDELVKQGFNDSEPIELIKSADFNLLRAILTGYIRQERFGEGLWIRAVKEKVFLSILKRLQEIML